MGRQKDDRVTRRNEELNDLLEYLLTQIQEIREEFTSALDNLEDMFIDALNGIQKVYKNPSNGIFITVSSCSRVNLYMPEIFS